MSSPQSPQPPDSQHSAQPDADGYSHPPTKPRLTERMLAATPRDVDPDEPPEGYDLIREIERDHRFCANCYQVKKDIEEPPEWLSETDRYRKTATDSMVGWAWPRRHVSVEFLPRHSRTGRSGTLKPTTICSCGAASGSVRLRPLSAADAEAYARHLSATAWELHYEHRNRAAFGVDASAWRDMRIAGALAHDTEALVTAIKKYKRTPELTALNMTGEWPRYSDDDPSPPYPDPLFRRAFRVAAKRPPESCLTVTAVTAASQMTTPE